MCPDQEQGTRGVRRNCGLFVSYVALTSVGRRAGRQDDRQVGLLAENRHWLGPRLGQRLEANPSHGRKDQDGQASRMINRRIGGPDRIRTGDLQRDRLACLATTPRARGSDTVAEHSIGHPALQETDPDPSSRASRTAATP
jgi:hypothetical protein